MFEDISQDLIKKTEEYHEKYFNELQKKYETTENNKEFRQLMLPLRRFANKMTWVGWKCNDIKKLGISLDTDDELDEEDYKIILDYRKEIDNLMIDKIVSKSESFFS